MPGDRFRVASSLISHVASPIDFGIAVENLAVEAQIRHAYAVVVAGHGSEIKGKDQKIFLVLALLTKETTLRS